MINGKRYPFFPKLLVVACALCSVGAKGGGDTCCVRQAPELPWRTEVSAFLTPGLAFLEGTSESLNELVSHQCSGVRRGEVTWPVPHSALATESSVG